MLEKIAGFRKGIAYHLDRHIPELIERADRELVAYWRKELISLIGKMEEWARRLTKNDAILAEAAEFRRRTEEILNNRLGQLED